MNEPIELRLHPEPQLSLAEVALVKAALEEIRPNTEPAEVHVLARGHTYWQMTGSGLTFDLQLNGQDFSVVITLSGNGAKERAAASEETPTEVRISPLAFLRSMAVLLWDAFRHPFRTTEVDLSTGRVVRQS